MVIATFDHAGRRRIRVLPLGILSFAVLAAVPASAEPETFTGPSVRRHLDDFSRHTDYYQEDPAGRSLTPTTPHILTPSLAELQPVVIDGAAMPAVELPAVELPAADKPCPAGKPCPGVCRAPGHPEKPHRTLPGDRDRGDCPPYRYGLDDCVRAGQPHRVAPWAMPSVTSNYSGWFVGGGAAFGGRRKGPHEGTWGLDYHGHRSPHHVWMGWTHGRHQGGEGAYAADKQPLFPRE